MFGVEHALKLEMKPSSGKGIGQPLTVEQKTPLGVVHLAREGVADMIAALRAGQRAFEAALGTMCVESYEDYRKDTIALTNADTLKRRPKEVTIV